MSKTIKALVALLSLIIPSASFAAETELSVSELLGQFGFGEQLTRIFEIQENLKISQNIFESLQSSPWLVLLSIFITGAILLSFAGGLTQAYAENIRKKLWRSLFIGAAFFVIPIIIVALLVTGFGALFGLILLMSWIFTALVSLALSPYLLGSIFLSPSWANNYSKRLLVLTLGSLIMWGVAMIPTFGALILLALFMISLGSLVLAKLRFYKSLKKAKLL